MNKLKKIIEFAVENGWKNTLLVDWKDWDDAEWKLLTEGDSEFPVKPYFIFLFSHDFAKAVFGEGENEDLAECWDFIDIPGNYLCSSLDWEYHLMHAVISKDPIDYYYNYISEKGKKK